MKFNKALMPLPAYGAVFPYAGFSIKHYQKELSSAQWRILKDSQVVKTAHGPIEYSTAGVICSRRRRRA